jgi:hypothetical protein
MIKKIDSKVKCQVSYCYSGNNKGVYSVYELMHSPIIFCDGQDHKITLKTNKNETIAQAIKLIPRNRNLVILQTVKYAENEAGIMPNFKHKI